jgi:WD40 repeat protein
VAARLALVGHTLDEDVNYLAFSADGRLLASGGFDGTLRLWDVRARRPIGGPLTQETERCEYRQLASQAACSPRQARRALELFEELFPYPDGGSWFVAGWDLERRNWMREVIYGDRWEKLGAEDQLKVAGPALRSRAGDAEARIVPRPAKRKARPTANPAR